MSDIITDLSGVDLDELGVDSVDDLKEKNEPGDERWPCDVDDYVKAALEDPGGRRFVISGKRYPPVGSFTGWYISVGNESTNDTEYERMTVLEFLSSDPGGHSVKGLVETLNNRPGTRFCFILGEAGETWFDESLLEDGD